MLCNLCQFNFFKGNLNKFSIILPYEFLTYNSALSEAAFCCVNIKNFFLSLPFKTLVSYLKFEILLCFTDTTPAGWLAV